MPTYTIRYESGCLLNSLDCISGPSIFGRGAEEVQLACVAARGLNPFSLGAENVYFDGGSYM